MPTDTPPSHSCKMKTQPDTDHYFQKIIHDSKTHWVPMIRRKKIYWIEHAISKAKCGFTFGSGLAPFKEKNLGNHFLEEWLDLHFKGSTLHKTDWVTVLITYSITVCFNILQYDTVFTISLPIDTAPPTPIKWKLSLILATISNKWSTIEWKTESQWSGKNSLQNRKLGLQGPKFGFTFGYGYFPKPAGHRIGTIL